LNESDDQSLPITTRAWLELTLGSDLGSVFAKVLASCLAWEADDRPDISSVLDIVADGVCDLSDVVGDDEGVLLFRGYKIISAQANDYAPMWEEDLTPDDLSVADMVLSHATGLFRNYDQFGEVIDVTEVHNHLAVTRRLCLKLLNLQSCEACATRFSGDVYCPVDSAGVLQCRCDAATGTSYAPIHMNEKYLPKTLLTLNRCATLHKRLQNFSEAASLFDVCCYCSNETDLDAMQNYAILSKHSDAGRAYDEAFVRRIQSRFVSAVALDDCNVDVLIRYASFLHHSLKDFPLALTRYAAGIDLMEADDLINTSAKFFNTLINYACCLEESGDFSAADCSFSVVSALAPEDAFVQEQYCQYSTRVSMRSS
jgi:hypothetical protein